MKSTSLEDNEDKIDKKELKNSFASTILNSNFIILKCIKMAFSLEHILTNKGRIAMTIIVFFFIVVLIIFFVNDKNTLNKYFKTILSNKEKEEIDENEMKDGDNKNGNNIDKDNISIYKSDNQKGKNLKNTNRNINNSNTEKNNKRDSDKNILNSEKKMINYQEGKSNFPPKRNANKNSTHKYSLKNSFNFLNSVIKSSKEELNKINIISETKMKERLKLEEKKRQKIK